MKYKPGDKFVIEVTQIDGGFYYLKGGGYVDEDTLDPYTPYDETEAYQRGLNDAWEAARKIVDSRNFTELSNLFDGGNDRSGAYTVRTPYYVIQNYTAAEAIEKLLVYEEAQEIHVGDEVETVCEKFVVTLIGNDNYFGVEKGGALISANKNYCKKTGRRFPEVAALLEKMKDNANV